MDFVNGGRKFIETQMLKCDNISIIGFSNLCDMTLTLYTKLLKILRALEWIFQQPYSFMKVYSDSLFSLQAIFVHRTKLIIVPKIKQQLMTSVHNTACG